MAIRQNYRHTLVASYIGYITQAIVNNFVPLLFLTFRQEFGISIQKITLLVTVNFFVQLFIDFISTFFVDKIGYRCSIVSAHCFAVLGLVGLCVFPNWFGYGGLLLSVILYAIGGGLIEVLISPIVEACPTEKKSASMGLLHSFYCWGSLAVVLCSTAFFVGIGISHWRILACLWAIVPLCNSIYFCLVPIRHIAEGEESEPVGSLLKNKMFWLLVLMMVCAGASELSISQWASAFAESGLHISKTAGDLAGPCMFAALMGTARVVYAKFAERVSIRKYIAVCSILCIIGYILAATSFTVWLGLAGCGICGIAVAVMWPGTFSLATVDCPKGGTAMFALLALAGDVGCSSGPTLVGMVSGKFEDNLQIGLFTAMIFPILMLAAVWATGRKNRSVK